MKPYTYLTLILVVIVATGCRSSYRNDDRDRIPPPELLAFHMVDSFGVDSEIEPLTQLTLNPFRDSGLFEVFWDVDNEDDYFVEMSINDRPSLNGRVSIIEELCGPGLECDLFGEFFCEYNAEYSISCDLPSEEFPGQFPVLFDDLIIDLGEPQRMYFILEICDTNSNICEFQILDVIME